jgi:hypothetical protein
VAKPRFEQQNNQGRDYLLGRLGTEDSFDICYIPDSQARGSRGSLCLLPMLLFGNGGIALQQGLMLVSV